MVAHLSYCWALVLWAGSLCHLYSEVLFWNKRQIKLRENGLTQVYLETALIMGVGGGGTVAARSRFTQTHAPGWKKWLISGNLVQCFRHSRRMKSSQRIIFDKMRLTGTIGRPMSRNRGSARSITLKPSLWPSTCPINSNVIKIKTTLLFSFCHFLSF